MNDNDVSKAIFELLTGSAALTKMLAEGEDGIYEDQADENADRPFLIYNEASGVPTPSLGDGLLYDAFAYQVRAVVDGPSAKGAALIRDQVEAVLSDGALSIPNRNVVGLQKISNTRMTETVAGTRYNHRGAIYRIWTEDA